MAADCQRLIESLQPELIRLRRHFHRFPELSGQEYETQQKIFAELVALGLRPVKLAGTGVVVDIFGQQPGKTVALRADIDALPVQDGLEAEYRSVNQGVCHACGHDGHMAMLLGIAQGLVQIRTAYAGTIRLIFQPSEEELPGGALPMIEQGALDGVEAIFGMHLWQSLPFGRIGIKDGPVMAAPDNFAIVIHGQGGHGSLPYQTTDALITAAQIAIALQTVVRQTIDPVEPAVLSLGELTAGTAPNIIPETAVLRGTVRTFTPSARDKIFAQLEQTVAGICAITGAKYELDKIYGCPPVVNDRELTKTVRRAVERLLGTERMEEMPPLLGGEDFSYYQEQIPGVFFFVGSGGTTEGFAYPQHHGKFDLDERALVIGATVMLEAALLYLESEIQG